MSRLLACDSKLIKLEYYSELVRKCCHYYIIVITGLVNVPLLAILFHVDVGYKVISISNTLLIHDT